MKKVAVFGNAGGGKSTLSKKLSGDFNPPAGWPKNSLILKSSINSYRMLWLCDRYLTPKYREYIQKTKNTKNVYHLRSSQQIEQFLASINSGNTNKNIVSDEKN
jgi:ABC-type antimicrobial peptide transport system ATPase subunit